MAEEDLQPGLYELLVTPSIAQELDALSTSGLHPERRLLADVEASDRLSRQFAAVLSRAIEMLPDGERAAGGTQLIVDLLEQLAELQADSVSVDNDVPVLPGEVLAALLRRNPDGTPIRLDLPLTPLLDTTLLTNSPGEPAIGHELRAEIASADSIDVVMAFVRWSGIRPLVEALRSHCHSGKDLRLVTTTYTNSTELRALDELVDLGAQVRVSYDTASTRLHAKAWHFRRESGYSTAYIGSSNLTHSAQVTGLEWNVRVAGVRNPDVLAKVSAVFDAYWESGDFVPFESEEFQRRTAVESPAPDLLPPIEVELKPFQERLLEEIEVQRAQGHHRNLLVAATGTGKTVMAAVDYARLRTRLCGDRLLFVAHREEILDQSRAMFRLALRDASFGEKWVGGERPQKFDHVFASIQSLNASGLDALDPSHFDVVVVDEFHHAAAPSYEALLDRVNPVELLGLTATPERMDGLDVLRHFDGQIAAELRVWDAIDQHYLVPFAYFGVHDGLDLTEVPWKRGRGYDIETLTNVFTSDDAWARRVVKQVRDVVDDVRSMRSLGFCVSVAHAQFMADHFNQAGIPAVAVWGDSPAEQRRAALADLAVGRVNVVFTVDLFNEGIDVPTVDTLLLLRPTESATLFLQQLGRGLRRAYGKSLCTVLDFVGTHRKEFRFDRRFRALLGGSRKDVERQIEAGFPFLPSGCHLELDSVAQAIVLQSIRDAIPSTWRAKCEELRSLGDVDLAQFLSETELELEDVYASNHSWTEMRRAAGMSVPEGGPDEPALLRAVGRLLHIDDVDRLVAYQKIVSVDGAASLERLVASEDQYLRMLIGSLTPMKTSAALSEMTEHLWGYPNVLAELRQIFALLPQKIDHVSAPIGLDRVPLRVHARYTRTEILAALAIGSGGKPPTWQTGVWWDEESQTDLFAFTLDKSAKSFSPTTRYRDYAISPELIHWESQAATSRESETGQRYLHQTDRGTNVVLFARLNNQDRAFWCLGPATYVSSNGDRPIAITWQLDHRLPGDVFAAFAAAVA